MDFVVQNNGKINIIFLHGWGADYKSFYFLKDVLKNHTLHFANLDGFGNCPEPTDITIQGYAKRLENYISTNNFKNVIVVGHSFGGRVAIEYASKNHLLGLVLVDSAGIKPKYSIIRHCKLLRYKLVKGLANIGLVASEKLKNYGSTDYKQASPQMKLVLKCCVRYNQKHLLKYIQTKTLIIWGTADADTPLYMAKILHKKIKDSKLELFYNCGHFSFIDNQYKFYTSLQNFIQNITKGECYE